MRIPINLDASVDALDAEHLLAVVDLWLEDRRARLPAYTVNGYASKLAYFRDWWTGVAAWKSYELTPADLHQFDRWLQHHARTSEHKPLAYNTRRDVLRRLRQCLHWAFADRRFLPVDVSVWVPVPPPQKKQGRVATLAELRRLIDATAASSNPLRDGCAIALLMQTGIRRIELCTIQVETIQMAADWSGVLRVVGKHTSANPTGERPVVFDAFAGKYVAAYLDAQGWRDGPLLRNKTRGPMDVRTADRIMDATVKRAGLVGVIAGCHDLRRAFVTHFRRRNRGEEFDHLLRRQIGHSSAATTDIYDLIDVADLVDVIRGPLC